MAPKKTEKTVRDFLPPGFRTLTPWKILLAVVGYTSILYLGITLEDTEASSIANLRFNNIFFTFMYLALVAFYFNYLDIQRFFPFMRREGVPWKIFGLVTGGVIIMFGLITLLSLIEIAIWGKWI